MLSENSKSQSDKRRGHNKPGLGSEKEARQGIKDHALANIDELSISRYEARQFVYGTMRHTETEIKRPTLTELRMLNERRRAIQQAEREQSQSQAQTTAEAQTPPPKRRKTKYSRVLEKPKLPEGLMKLVEKASRIGPIKAPGRLEAAQNAVREINGRAKPASPAEAETEPKPASSIAAKPDVEPAEAKPGWPAEAGTDPPPENAKVHWQGPDVSAPAEPDEKPELPVIETVEITAEELSDEDYFGQTTREEEDDDNDVEIADNSFDVFETELNKRDPNKTELLNIPKVGVVRGHRGTLELVVLQSGLVLTPSYNSIGMLKSVKTSDGLTFAQAPDGKTWDILDKSGEALNKLPITSLTFDKKGNLSFISSDGTSATLNIDGSVNLSLAGPVQSETIRFLVSLIH